VAETIPGFNATGWFALLTPKGTPDAIVRKVNQDLKTALENAETQQKLETLATFARPMTPEQTAAFLHSEQQVWKPVVRAVGFSQ
jgi:tripartite-type tricarboxylate transporter receptor subunit TctC